MFASNVVEKPYVRILEPPALKNRFRYESEKRVTEITGISSRKNNKKYPSIEIVGNQGKAAVIKVSCVTKDRPFRIHPHKLVGEECENGVCLMERPPGTKYVSLVNIGIQCAKINEVRNILEIREKHEFDPFNAGFDHKEEPKSINLSVVRLCFQVMLKDENTQDYTIKLPPIVSEPIYDEQSYSNLSIHKLSHCNSYVNGSQHDIILLCKNVTKKDIQIRLYEEQKGYLIWENICEPLEVHERVAILFHAPPYKTLDITEPVKVYIQLIRPSDGATGASRPFEYLPLPTGPRKKRIRLDEISELLGLEQFNISGAERPPAVPYHMNIPSTSATPSNWCMEQQAVQPTLLPTDIQPISQEPFHSTELLTLEEFLATPRQPTLQQSIQPPLQPPLIDKHNLFDDIFMNLMCSNDQEDKKSEKILKSNESSAKYI